MKPAIKKPPKTKYVLLIHSSHSLNNFSFTRKTTADKNAEVAADKNIHKTA